MNKPFEILLIEDNPADIKLMMRVFSSIQSPYNMSTARDGVEAMDYLFLSLEGKNVRPPDLIILDLNLPRKDGREFLKEMKSHHILRRIPVIVFTTSGSDQDILSSYDHYANCYIQKPISLEGLRKVVSAIEMFWMTTVELPPHGTQEKE